MLVLSRRIKEKIVIPALGVQFQLLGVKGQTAKIGIEAPSTARVYREELLEGTTPNAVSETASHAMRNRLNKLALSLHLFQRQWEMGKLAEARASFDKVLEIVDSMSAETAPKVNLPKTRVRSLLVEDDSNERELLAGLLNMHGCDCQTAADGLEALKCLENSDMPDVVLLDMLMPRCDGPETLARIRKDPRLKDLKVFAISGSCPGDLGVPTGPGGIDAWFPKPLNPSKFWDTLQDKLKASTN